VAPASASAAAIQRTIVFLPAAFNQFAHILIGERCPSRIKSGGWLSPGYARAPVAPATAINYHAGVYASQGGVMANDAKANEAEKIRVLAAWRGLGRALELSPASVAGAIERGRRIASFPEKFTPVTEPATRFTADPKADA